MLIHDSDTETYALSERGRNLATSAVSVCVRHAFSWKQLWDPREVCAQVARDVLGLNLREFKHPEFSGAILGAYAVASSLQQVALGRQPLVETVAALRAVGLIGMDNICFAAERLGVSVEDILVLLLPEAEP